MKSLICLILFFCASISLAQDSHNHSDHENEIEATIPPHGGTIVESGKHNVEILIDPFGGEQKLMAWLLNQRNKTKRHDKATAELTLKYKDGRIITQTMKVKEGMFYTDIEDFASSFNAIIIFTFNNKTLTVAYFYKGLAK